MTQIEVRTVGALSDIAKSLEKIERHLAKLVENKNSFGGITFKTAEETEKQRYEQTYD